MHHYFLFEEDKYAYKAVVCKRTRERDVPERKERKGVGKVKRLKQDRVVSHSRYCLSHAVHVRRVHVS